MHLEIPTVPLAGCAMNCIGPLPATSKGNMHALTFICWLTLYLIMLPLKSKMAEEVSMAYIKKFFLRPHVQNISYKIMVWNLKTNN